jgi:hypothetical protein
MSSNRPQSPHEIEAEIWLRIDELEALNDEYEVALAKEADKTVRYKAESAKRFLDQTEGTQKFREAKVDWEMRQLHLEMETAKAVAKGIQARMTSKRAIMDLLRTAAANLRTMTS